MVESDRLVEVLGDYHPEVGLTLQGRAEVVITVVGESLRQALITAMAVVSEASEAEIFAVEIMPTEEFEGRRRLERVPHLLSVSEAAVALGISPQAIRQRLDIGTIAGTKIGSTWAIPQAEVHRLKAVAPKPAADRRANDGRR
ncbi:helix-turn-helix domain-containing protein [Geodermatophilus africanus]|uniref:helix-turn-helix domain-containing protein n=1 Tax=Geodermatophilus africanus TaxID=1137993 RepID=UPI0011147338|nr:helix-turn-helix domain-containing protein [Geodermatophilus africanus]